MKDFFTTRELALCIWALLFLIWVLTKSNVRKSFTELLGVAFQWKILLLFVLVAAYTVSVVWCLRVIGFWTPDLVKDTVLWFLFSGVTLAFSSVDIKKEESIWQRAFVDQLKVVVIIEYLVNTYTFALWAEMILVPLIAFIAMLDAVARTDVKFSAVAQLMFWVQAFVGATIIAFALHKALMHRDHFHPLDTIRAVTLVPLLSILFIPFMYLFFVISSYEQLFLRLKFGPDKDRAVLRYAKVKLFSHLGMRPQKVCVFLRKYAFDLMQITTRADVDKMLAQEGGESP